MSSSPAETSRVEGEQDEGAVAEVACGCPDEEGQADEDHLQLAQQRLEGRLATLTVAQQLAKGS